MLLLYIQYGRTKLQTYFVKSRLELSGMFVKGNVNIVIFSLKLPRLQPVLNSNTGGIFNMRPLFVLVLLTGKLIWFSIYIYVCCIIYVCINIHTHTHGRKEIFYLTTHSTHFIYGYMASDIW